MSNRPPHDKKGCGGGAAAIVIVLGMIMLGCLIFIGGCMGMMFLG